MKKCNISILIKRILLDENLKNNFRMNMHTENIEFLCQPIWNKLPCQNKAIKDIDISQLKHYLSTVHEIDPNDKVLIDALLNISLDKQYNPIKEDITSVKWDGVERLNKWLINATGCEDNIYTNTISERIMIATVKRIYEPGTKFDHMLILEGEQGIGKSTLVERMAGKWYLDTSLENKDKDLIDSIRSAIWVEFSEMTGMERRDIEWLRSFISRKVDCVRLSYDRLVQPFPRKCVFIGTINPSGNNMYLRDDTGNRRYWPIECNKIDIKYVDENRSQIWAEAYEKYKMNKKYWLDDLDIEALEILKNIHREREIESPSTRQVRRYLIGKTIVSMDELLQSALKINIEHTNHRQLLSAQTMLGIIMKKEKWRKGINENRDKYYPPEQKWEE